MYKLRYLIVALTLTSSLFPLTAFAAEAPSQKTTKIKRWSIESGVKMFLLDYQVKVNYRLPLANDQWGIYGSYAPLTAEYDLFPGRFHNAMIGARFYPTDDYLGILSPFQAYFTGAVQFSFNPTGAKHPLDIANDTELRETSFYGPFAFYIEAGGDFMFTENFGLNVQLGGIGILPISPQAELNLKYAF